MSLLSYEHVDFMIAKMTDNNMEINTRKCWRRMEKIKWSEKVLERIGEKLTLL